MSSTTLTMVAVIMAATFMVTAFVWQQQPPLQQAHALMVSKSRSPSCVDNQPCHTSVTNSSTPHTSSPYSPSSSKLAPSPAAILAPQSFLPNSSSSHPPSHHTSLPSSKLTASPAAAASVTSTSPPSPKLKHHNFHSSTSTTNHTPSLNSTGSLSNDLSHLFDDIR
jgi:hypothetical protein